jgi:hypothetical protein
MDPAPQFIPAAPPVGMWTSGVATPAASHHAKSIQELAQHALHWECTWRSGLMGATATLAATYTPQVREELRSWGLHLEFMSKGLREHALAGHVTGIEERLEQFDRIWAANQRILLSVGSRDGRPIEQLAADPAQRAMVMFLSDRNAFFRKCRTGGFDHVRSLPPQDRVRFTGLMDRLEICSDPAAGNDVMRLLDGYSLWAGPIPWWHF